MGQMESPQTDSNLKSVGKSIGTTEYIFEKIKLDLYVMLHWNEHQMTRNLNTKNEII